MKYSQTNAKPSYTPRKPTGGLTQQSAQPEPQNLAGTRRREVNLGSEKVQEGRCFCERREDGDCGGWGRRIWENHPSPKAAGGKWKLDTAAGTKLKREKGERRGFNLNEDCKQGEHKGCNSAAPHLAVLWWEGESPGREQSPGGSQMTQEKAVPLMEGHLV